MAWDLLWINRLGGYKEENMDYTGYGIAEGVAKGLGNLANTLQNVQVAKYQMNRQNRIDEQQSKVRNLQIKKMELDPNLDPEHVENVKEQTKIDTQLKKQAHTLSTLTTKKTETDIKNEAKELVKQGEEQTNLWGEYNENRKTGNWKPGESWDITKEGYISKKVSALTPSRTVQGQWAQDPENPDSLRYQKYNPATGGFEPTELTKSGSETRPKLFDLYKQAEKEAITQMGGSTMAGIEQMDSPEKRAEFNQLKNDNLKQLKNQFGYGEAELLDFSELSGEEIQSNLQSMEIGETFEYGGTSYKIISFDKQTGEAIFDPVK